MKINQLIPIAFAALLVSAANVPPPVTGKPVAVLELFTSQGCSSCPPADRLLEETAMKAAAANQPVYALSFHVDYWDRLGWRDPFSDARYTDRQRQYARQLKHSSLYTPQVVLNGTWEFVGSNRAELTGRLAEALTKPAPVTLQITATPKGPSVLVETKVAGTLPTEPEGAVLHVALVSNSVTTMVKRGENAGRTLTHTNVVRAFTTVRAAAASQVSLSLPVGFEPGNGAVIAYLQANKTGVILGAERVGLK